MRDRSDVVITKVLLCELWLFCTWGLAQDFEITRSTIDGGGAMRTIGGDFELSGTIGQPDAGVLTGGPFELTGGFWFGLAPGDCEEDGDVDLHDSARLGACLLGPGLGPSTQCRCFDVNRDGHVDLADFAEFQKTFTGF